MKALVQDVPADAVSFVTSRFGPVSVGADKVITFARGIPGFEHLRRFILIDHDAEGIFKWLQAVDDPVVAFLLTNPSLYKQDYRVPLRKNQTEELGISDPGSLVVMVMVCASQASGQVSLNLKGPIVFNSLSMRGMQCIIDRDDYQANYLIKI